MVRLYLFLNSFLFLAAVGVSADEGVECKQLVMDAAMSLEVLNQKEKIQASLELDHVEWLGKVLVSNGYLQKWYVRVVQKESMLKVGYHFFVRSDCVVTSIERFRPFPFDETHD